MLKTLSIKNFALIDDLEINFENGLSAITGETGSGKSILLESLSLLFGKRSDSDYIRHGAKKATVKGEFILSNEQSFVLDLPNHIVLEREIDESGRHVVKLNHEVITLGKLKNITSSIGLIHGQDDTYLLLDKNSLIDFVDQLDIKKINDLQNDFLLKLSNYHEEVKKFESLKKKKDANLERLEILERQRAELESYNLEENEKVELEEIVDKLKNFDLIKQNLQISYDLVTSETFQLNQLFDAYKHLEKIKSYDSSYERLSTLFMDSFYNLEDSINDLKNILKNFDFDEDLFNQYQERIYELNNLELKYGKEINNLIIYLSEIKDEISLMSNYDQFIIDSENKIKKLYDETYKRAKVLSDYRMKLAERLEMKLIEHLKELDLINAQFKVTFEPFRYGDSFYENGIDKVDFLISLNEGEPLKPLSKVASGGEKARFMFSLKSIYAKERGLSMVIFDEVDVGISGKTAAKVAQKMKELSNDMQVLVVTHLPQVAARSKMHYKIYKEKENQRMKSFIKTLTFDERIMELASMLSDEKITQFAIEQAKSLLNND